MDQEKLLQDPSFINWATGKNEKDIDYWDNYLVNHPEQASSLMKARGEILSEPDRIDGRDAPVHLNKAWSLVEAGMRKSERRMLVGKIMRVASVAAVLVLGALAVYQFTGKAEMVKVVTRMESTSAGEIRNIRLPDGSMVTLNGNSSIRYPENLDVTKVREVEVTGELFFEVTHNNSAFRVLFNGTEITVLGTSFNVNTRTSIAQVSLLEGKVNVQAQGGDKVVLHPGQTAVIDSAITVTNEDVAAIASWKDYVWTFKNTPVAYLIERLDHDFGMVVKVESPSIMERKISGNLSTKNLDVLYQALESILDIRVQKGKGVITLVQK